MGLPVQDFDDLLRINGGRWGWAGRHFTTEASQRVGGALKQHAGGLWEGIQPRPFGLAVVRLLWELGAISMDGNSLSSGFIREGQANIHVSLATPWYAGEIPWEVLDEFLGETVIYGDGQLRSVEGASRDAGVHSISNTRAFTLGWRDNKTPAPVLGFGYKRGEHPDLEIALFDGREKPVVHILGQPWFTGDAWPAHAMRVYFPGAMDGVVPVTYEVAGPNGAERFYLPGSEPGLRIELEGHAFTGVGRLPARARSYRDEAPGIRLHLSYVPGWGSAGLAGVRLVEWSGLPADQKDFYREWSPFMYDGEGPDYPDDEEED